MTIDEELCSICAAPVIVVREGVALERFEIGSKKMLVVLNYFVEDGKKRVALGPCQKKIEPLKPGEEPVVYFGHPVHEHIGKKGDTCP